MTVPHPHSRQDQIFLKASQSNFHTTIIAEGSHFLEKLVVRLSRRYERP